MKRSQESYGVDRRSVLKFIALGLPIATATMTQSVSHASDLAISDSEKSSSALEQTSTSDGEEIRVVQGWYVPANLRKHHFLRT